jgi:hypothetical protein
LREGKGNVEHDLMFINIYFAYNFGIQKEKGTSQTTTKPKLPPYKTFTFVFAALNQEEKKVCISRVFVERRKRRKEI